YDGVSYSESESKHEEVGDEVLFMTKDVMRPVSNGPILFSDSMHSKAKEGDGIETELMYVQTELKHVEKNNKKLKAQIKEYEAE
ncbi:hypothetical protein KI387_000261, partial [Taxus chinensis]